MLRATELAGFAGAFLAGGAYVPQIRHLIKEHCSAGISRPAFYVWLVASWLVLIRAVAIHDNVFIVLGVIQVGATAIICLYARVYEHSRCATHVTIAELSMSASMDGAILSNTSPVSARGTVNDRLVRTGVGRHEMRPATTTSGYPASRGASVDDRNAHGMSDDELVDEMSMESFPASDPPSYWAGSPAQTAAVSVTEGKR